MQITASFSNGKAVGADGNSAEILKSIPWRALQKIRRTWNEVLWSEQRRNWNVVEENHCSFSEEEDHQQAWRTDKREFAFRVSWPSGTVDVSPSCWRWSWDKLKGRKRIGTKPTNLASKKEEVRRRSPLPSDSWQQRRESRGLSLDLLFALWM